jgi:hypothetical protein
MSAVIPIRYPERTPEYMSEVAALEARYACSHDIRELRRRVIEGGSIQLARQCLRCGNAGQPIAHSVAGVPVAELPEFDYGLAENYRGALETERDDLRQRHIAIQDGAAEAAEKAIRDAAEAAQDAAEKAAADAREQWFRDHDAYLLTPEWRHRCGHVRRRAGGMCEGCGDRPIAHVHHLTYKNHKQEFLWELPGGGLRWVPREASWP